jgi:hypothetical protein
MTKADGLNVKIFEAFVFWIDNQVLGFSCHEFRSEPCSEELSVEGLPELVMVVFVGIF